MNIWMTPCSFPFQPKNGKFWMQRYISYGIYDQKIVIPSLCLEQQNQFSFILLSYSLMFPEWEPEWWLLMENQQWLEDTTLICWNPLKNLTVLHGHWEERWSLEAIIMECPPHFQKTSFLALSKTFDKENWSKLLLSILFEQSIKLLDWALFISSTLLA